ncbi:MAG: SdrD B-like domain-containing protein [Ruminococcus sp.]
MRGRPRGFIGQWIWDDENYNGIRDTFEKGIKGVTVTLKPFYYDSATGKWVAITGEDRDIKTSESGSYVFQNVSTYYKKDGKTYLAGYRLYVDPEKNADLYKKYAITKYNQYPSRRSAENSDLQYTGDMQYYLIGDDWIEYDANGNVTATHHNYDTEDNIIIIAGKTTNQNTNVIDYKDTHYDTGEAQRLLDYSGGFTEIQTSEVTGYLWEDNGKNAAGECQEAFDYDGIRNTVTAEDGTTQFYEKGIAGATVQLEQYVLQNGSYQLVHTYQVKTDADGKYTFSDVSTYAEINGEKVLAHYRLKLLSLPSGMENYAVTRYRQNGDAETQVVDSHLISQNEQHGAGYTDYDIASYLTSPADGDYFITAKKSQPETEAGIDGNTYFEPYILYDDANFNKGDYTYAYDYIKAKDYDGYDGGLKAFETASVSGVVWEDTNYNGVQDDSEEDYHDNKNPAVVHLQRIRTRTANGCWKMQHSGRMKP